MTSEERIKNEQFLVITKKLAFLQELKTRFDSEGLLSLEDIILEESLYLSQLLKLIDGEFKKKNISQ